MYDVFISYRSKGGFDLAGRIKDHLSQKGFNPFFAVETMKSGRFDKQIYNKIDECQHFLLILSPKGLMRCWKKKDWVRKEIEYAIKKKKHIVTVLMPGFSFPKKLPASIDIIRYEQAVVSNRDSFEYTIDTICKYLNDGNWSEIEYEEPEDNKKNVQPRNKKQVVGIALCLVLLFSLLFLALSGKLKGVEFNVIKDETAPTVFISPPLSVSGTNYVEPGGEIVFTVEASDNKVLEDIHLFPAMIELDEGLTAEITVISTEEVTKRKIVLSNISGTPGKHKITLKEGVAVDKAGNKSFSLESLVFYIESDTVSNDSVMPTINISKPTISKDKVVYYVVCGDETTVGTFEIRPLDVSTMGFVADVEIIGKGSTKQIVLTNINATSNDCYIWISEGVAVDAAGNKSRSVKSSSFDISKPAITISAPSDSSIENGGTVAYTISACDNVQITYFGVHKEHIKMNGFTADIEIKEKSDFVREVIFSNIQSTSDNIKYFEVSEGIAKDDDGNTNKPKNSPKFEVYD